MKNISQTKTEQWSTVIKPSSKILDLQLQEIWKYRDLILLFVRRDFVSIYKQTILGPLWFFIQPFIMTITFTLIFNRVAKIPTDGLPPMVFYMSGLILWNYFAACLNKSSSTFISNAAIFGKVYFPRLIVPISDVITNIISFGIQFLLFIIVIVYFVLNGVVFTPNFHLLLLPLLLLMMAATGLGLGIIISSLTIKYRDLTFLITFGVQLLMYATPVIYPMSLIPDKTFNLLGLIDLNYKTILLLNPISSIIETFRFGLLGVGTFDWLHLSYSVIFMVVILFIGIVLFNKVEKSFMDVI